MTYNAKLKKLHIGDVRDRLPGGLRSRSRIFKSGKFDLSNDSF